MNEFIEDKIEKLLSNEGLSDWTEEVIRTLVPCLVLEPQEEDNIPKGTSKWGGAPDLPPETPYPMDALQPLTFIAQFNLISGDAPVLQPTCAGFFVKLAIVRVAGIARRGDKSVISVPLFPAHTKDGRTRRRCG